MTPDERIAAEFSQLTHALNSIAGSFERLATLGEKWYDRIYPVRTPRDATVTRVPSAKDKLLEELSGAGDSTLEEWLTSPEEEELGPRERELVKKKTD